MSAVRKTPADHVDVPSFMKIARDPGSKRPYSEHPSTAGVGLWSLVREDHAAHGRDWTRPGFRAVAVHRFGVWRMRVRSRLLRAPLTFLYRRLFRFVRNVYGIEVPYTARLGRRVVIEHQSAIVIHGESTVGDDCRIRQGCTLGNKTMDRPYDAPTLGRRVNVGAGAKVLGAVTIGDDANVGANAVVVRDVPSGATAVGVPAKVLPSKGASATFISGHG